MNIKLNLQVNNIKKINPDDEDDVNIDVIDDDLNISPKNKHKLSIKDSPYTNIDLNVSTSNHDSNLKTASKLKNRKKPGKRSSMTDIDFLNRQAVLNEIKESTRTLVEFTIKNLDKMKPVEHFKNEHYVSEDKDKEFEYYYDIISSLGEGSSSVVKLCKDKLQEKLYAVKIFRAFDDEYINFAKNEFHNMKSIDCSQVAKVYEMFYDQNKCKIYTVMEFCKGITLQKLISETGPLPGI
jgi:hypothetical protein